MERDRLSQLAHAHHPIAAPLDDASVDRLLDRAAPPDVGTILDLGCGRAAWLVRALRRWPTASAIGVDTSAAALAMAGDDARAAGVADRLTLVEGPAVSVDASADLVLSVGATHAFGGLGATAEAVRARVANGGAALLGEGFWARTPPSPAALTALGAGEDDWLDLAGTVALVEAAGFVTAWAHVSSDHEWDDYEWSWTGSLLEWAAAHPDDPDAEEVATTARTHRDQWLNGYRGELGFVTLVLRPA